MATTPALSGPGAAPVAPTATPTPAAAPTPAPAAAPTPAPAAPQPGVPTDGFANRRTPTGSPATVGSSTPAAVPQWTPQTGTGNPVSQHTLLQPGSRGPEVTELQQRLKLAGYEAGQPGVYDAKTEGSVRQYQTDHELKVDGQAGQQTWGALLGQNLPPGTDLLKQASGTGAAPQAATSTGATPPATTAGTSPAPAPGSTPAAAPGSTPAAADTSGTAPTKDAAGERSARAAASVAKVVRALDSKDDARAVEAARTLAARLDEISNNDIQNPGSFVEASGVRTGAELLQSAVQRGDQAGIEWARQNLRDHVTGLPREYTLRSATGGPITGNEQVAQTLFARGSEVMRAIDGEQPAGALPAAEEISKQLSAAGRAVPAQRINAAVQELQTALKGNDLDKLDSASFGLRAAVEDALRLTDPNDASKELPAVAKERTPAAPLADARAALDAYKSGNLEAMIDRARKSVVNLYWSADNWKGDIGEILNRAEGLRVAVANGDQTTIGEAAARLAMSMQRLDALGTN